MELKRLELYSREEIKNIFDPESNNHNWNQCGGVNLFDSENWVEMLNIDYEAETPQTLSEDGIFTWFTENDTVAWKRKLIADCEKYIDKEIYNLDLFLRKRNNSKYIYLGKLKHLSSKTIENKTFFESKLFDWSLNEEIKDKLSNSGIKLLERVTNLLSPLN